jgi:GABA permease
MNAVVLTAVLSCLNSGLYTSSRMLFVLAARREAPAQLVKVTGRGVPRTAILASSVVGFLCVIAAAIDEDGVFPFLLNSSGAIILFVYLLISISQIRLRMRVDESTLKVKMWLFPGLSILTAVAIVGVLLQMGLTDSVRSQLVLSLLSWAVVLVLFAVNKFVLARRGGDVVPGTDHARRVLVLANETVNSGELLDELRRIDTEGAAEYFVCVPASPVETGQAAVNGPLQVWNATAVAARERLEHTLTSLRSDSLRVEGELGDYRPLRALEHAVETFRPDQIVIATRPLEDSVWQRYDVVDRARSTYPIPVTHVVAHRAVPALVEDS